MYPPFWMIYRAPYAEDRIGDYRLAQNGMVLISPYVLHRDRRYWESPDDFNPERFAPEASSARRRFVYFPFGGGPHQCVGSDFAMMETQFILAILAQRYRWRLAPSRPIEPEALVTLRPKQGVWIIPELLV